MSSPARVAYVIDSLEQGGAERQLVELVNGLDRARFAPSLVLGSRKHHAAFVLRDCPVTVLDAAVLPLPGSVARLAEALRALQPDIVQGFKSWENTTARLAGARIGARVVGSVRRPRIPADELLAEALTHRHADVVIVNSVGIRDELVARAGVPSSLVEVVESGVDLARFSPLDDDARARRRAELGWTGAHTLLHPGRISPEKNQLAVVRAVSLLARRGALPSDFRLVLAGRDTLLAYGRIVRAAIALGGVGRWVTLAGAVSDIERWTPAADAVLLPSRFEGLSSAAVEALACGVPALVSRAANADAVVSDGVEGLVAEAHDPAPIADLLARFIALPADARRAMGLRGRVHAERRFAVQRMIERTQNVYARLLASPPRNAGTRG